MAAKANIARGYRARLGIIALALIGFAGWAAYDGFIYWPKLVERWEAFEQVEENNPRDWQAAWVEYAQERGWPTDKPDKKTQQSLFTQYVIIVLTLPLGLYFAYSFVRAGGRWVESTGEGLRTHDGREATWDQIKSINKDRWKSKGIAVVTYDSEQGEKTITLDDWKFEREPTAAILAEIEAHTGLGDDAGEDQPTGEAATASDDAVAPSTDAATVGDGEQPADTRSA